MSVSWLSFCFNLQVKWISVVECHQASHWFLDLATTKVFWIGIGPLCGSTHNKLGVCKKFGSPVEEAAAAVQIRLDFTQSKWCCHRDKEMNCKYSRMNLITMWDWTYALQSAMYLMYICLFFIVFYSVNNANLLI